MTAVYIAMEGTADTGEPADRPGEACEQALKACRTVAVECRGLADAAAQAWEAWKECRAAKAKASPESLDSALRECHAAWQRAYKAAMLAWAHTVEEEE